MSVYRLLAIHICRTLFQSCLFHIHKCLPHLQSFSCLVVPSKKGSAMFCFLLLRFNKAKHCRVIGQNGEMTKKSQISCHFHINVCHFFTCLVQRLENRCVLGNFGQSGLQREENPYCHKQFFHV